MKKCFINAVLILSVFSFYMGCRTDDSSSPLPPITSLQFEDSKISLNIGEQVSVKILPEPIEAKGNGTITYRASSEGFLTISDMSNDGCVIKADAMGSVVLIASTGSVSAYLEIDVIGNTTISTPYIVVPTQVIELNEGARKSVQVSLYGGVTSDNAAFSYTLEKTKENIIIETSTNTVVVEGVMRGSQKIFIDHPKSDYQAEILVFVVGVDEEPKYITTAKNVIVVEKHGQNQQFSVNLVNGRQTDKSGFIYEVVENQNIIDILSSNETCNVTAKETGSAVIRVTHPLAEYPLDVRIIAVLGEPPYISLDKTFIILNKQESSFIIAEIQGSFPVTAVNNFSYSVSEPGVITIIKTNNQFFIEALNEGTTVLTVSNSNIEYSREVLIMVRGDNVILPDDFYITTSQNVIQMEIGQSPLVLNMQLVGGVEADRNSFSWMVEDSRIIEVESAHGNVSYERRVRSSSEIKDVFNGVALITPKKTGVSRIIISHTKSQTTGNVMVKVYPRGTFATMPILVGTDGLLKIVRGSSKDVELQVISGSQENIGTLNWSIENSNIASVTNSTALVNQIYGISSGTTKLLIEGENLKTRHESIVIVGTQNELDSRNVIYVDNIYQTVYTGQSVYVQIKDSQDDLINSNKYHVVSNNNNILYATVVKSRLLLQGVSQGEATVTIQNDDAENTLTLHVTVEPDKVTIDKPYTLTAPNFIGLVKGTTIDFSVGMAGSSESEQGKITWSSANSGIVKVTGNGLDSRLEAVAIGQTKINIYHSKSINEKTIIAYVVNSENELNNKVLLGLEKENYLLTIGQEIALSLITNATDLQKSQITWLVDDISIISLDNNGSSAFIRAIGEGTTKITISHPQNVISLVVYISVSNNDPGTRTIVVPSIIEMIVGENKVITAETYGLSQAEMAAIQWSIDDENVASISNDGDKSYVLGKKKGQAFITVKQDAIGYQKKIMLVCANTYEELENTYIIAAAETYYKINVGDIKNISLIFGSAGFPEAAKHQITWTVENNNVVRLNGNGENATFEGINEGVTKITASSNVSFKNVEITVEVSSVSVAGDYRFIYNAMKGLIIGENDTILVSISPAGAGYGLIEYDNQNNDVVTVNQTGAGNEFFLTAVGSGQSYLTIRHPKVPEPARILIYTATNQIELDNMFPISLAKTNYLIGVGEKVNVKIETINDDSAKLAKIKWSLDNNGIVSYTVVSKKEIQIQGAASGNCVFSISYDNTIIEKVYVSVKNNTAFDSNAKIITESIIGIVRGQNKETRITSNLASYEIEQLVWESENQGKVRVEPISGDNSRAILKGVANGETYITVKLGAIKRYILVYVCETDAAVGAYRAMNIDNQYYQLKRQEELTLSVYYAAIKPSASTVWEDIYDNNVIEITPLGGKAQIKGINEGIATLKISNSDCLTPIYITIEVSNALEGKVESNLDLWYLSISKTIYVLNPDKQSETVSVAVNPVGFTEDEVLKIKWEKTEGPSLVQIYPSGRQCTVAPGTGEGTAIIRISHPKSNNYLEIKVIMSRDGIVEESMPYIRLDDDIIRVPINGEIQTGIYIENLENQNIALFTASSNNANANVTLTGNVLTVKGKNFGQALITINHPSCRYPKNIVVIVTTTEDGVIYLTTDDNFSIIKKNDYKAIEVALVGFEEKNNTRYHWEADTPEDAALVSISSTGPKAVITGLNIGTARIKVTHEYCQYPLYIYVRISELVDNNPVYITTSNNIVSVKKGNSMQIKSELVNGMMAEYSLFQWSTSNRNIIELNYSGDQALIRGLEVGTAGITIAHPSSMNSITIIVIVEKDETESGIYITTDTQLVEMKPTDASRHINVRLVGGTAEDIYGFKWEIVDYISVIKNKDGTSKPVVALVANADSAYVMPTTNEGEATIRVSHPKTSYRLEFKVLVQLTSKIKFEKTNLIMDMLTSQSVSIEAPTGMTVIYESSDDKIASVMGTDKVCIIEGIKAGTVVITARNTSGTTSDEVVVKVNAVDTTVVEYIYTNTNILTLNTNMSSVSVSAKLVKATTPDDELPDTQYLVYTSTDTNVVSLYGSGPSVSVTPIGAGTAEIQIRYSNSADPNYLQHPTMKNYVKRIYVKVDVDEMIFSISDPLVLLTEGEQAIVTVKVDNVSDIDYDTDIVWASSDTEVATVGKISTVDKGTAQIVGLKAGISTITATYKGSIRRCTVQVSAPRVFAISTTYLDIAPGQTIPSSFDSTPIKITLQPETERFTYSVDSYNFIDVNVSSDSNGALVQITGKEAEGVTVITFTSGTMRCSLTVNNIRNYYLRWINKSNIREDPYVEDNILEAGRVESYKGSRWYVISYEINPRTDTLSLLGSGSPSLVTVEIDNAAKKVYLKPKASGYTILNFYAQQSNVSIELPVYFFYERIEPKWIWSESATYRGYIDKSKTLHSQVDTVQNAIWISDQEYVRIYLDMSYLNTTYPNHGLTISSLSGETIEKIYSGNSGNANLTKDTITAVPYVTSNYFEIRNMLVSKYGYLQEQLSSVDYYGYIKVHYTYFNGGTTKSQFTKNYIIYSEFWRRK